MAKLEKQGLTPVLLASLYAKHSDAAIAAMYGVSDVAISWTRRKWGIPTKTWIQRQEAQWSGLQLKDLTSEKLAVLYASRSDVSIGELYGVSKFTIRKLRKRCCIESTSKSCRCTHTEPLTVEQKEICIGTVLGDGHLLKRGVLKVSHYVGQLIYLKRLRDVIDLNRPIVYEEKLIGNGQLTYGFSFKTVQHVYFQELRTIFYPHGIRTFPSEVLQVLSDRSLAYWYFDDGCFTGDSLTIALGAVSAEEEQRIITDVSVRFGLSIKSRPTGSACRSILIRSSSHAAFFDRISRFVTPDMLHKLPKRWWPEGMLPYTYSKTEDPYLLPMSLVDLARDWSEKEESEKLEIISKFLDFWRTKGQPKFLSKPEELEVLLSLNQDHVIKGRVIKSRNVGQSSCNTSNDFLWESGELHDRIISILKEGRIPNSVELRRAFGFRLGFRPSASKALMDRYCVPNGVVYDPYADAGRLLGTVLSENHLKYVGFVESKDRFERLQKLHQWLVEYIPVLRDRVDLRFQTDDLPPYVSTIFTTVSQSNIHQAKKWYSISECSLLLGVCRESCRWVQDCLGPESISLEYSQTAYEEGPDRILCWIKPEFSQNENSLLPKMSLNRCGACGGILQSSANPFCLCKSL